MCGGDRAIIADADYYRAAPDFAGGINSRGVARKFMNAALTRRRRTRGYSRRTRSSHAQFARGSQQRKQIYRRCGGAQGKEKKKREKKGRKKREREREREREAKTKQEGKREREIGIKYARARARGGLEFFSRHERATPDRNAGRVRPLQEMMRFSGTR